MNARITKTTFPIAALLAAASAVQAADTYTVTEGGLTTTYDAVSYYSKPLAYSTTRDPDPPKYVTPATKSPWSFLNQYSWLDAGLDYRFRYEYRDDDIRRATDGLDEPLLHRTRLYLGVHDVIDPLRFAVEIQDSHRYGSKFAKDNRDINQLEPIRAYAELYFKDLLPADAQGNSRPISVRYGLHNFEFLDRRLIGNNQWRNTANHFRGIHASIGQETSDWQVDLLHVQPMNRLSYQPDRTVAGQTVNGVIGHWRKWSEDVTIEPFYFQFKDTTIANGGRVVDSPGIRAYGVFGKSGFDFDASFIAQSGHNGTRQVDAWAAWTELGYSFGDPWKSRFSVFYGVISGDRDPNDTEDNRFERFFGFARPWSADDYVILENLIAPKIRYEAVPDTNLKFDVGYSWFKLYSATDRFSNLASIPTAQNNINRDQTGQSGRNVGSEFDIRFLWQVTPQTLVTVGYAHFISGEWTSNRLRVAGRPSNDSDFAYVEVLTKLF